MRRFFRRPSVRRCRKVSSKTFKGVNLNRRPKISPCGGKSSISSDTYQRNTGVGFYGRPQEGYPPCDWKPATQQPPAFYSTTSMSNTSECFTDDSRYSAKGGDCRSSHPVSNGMRLERLSAGGTVANEKSAHRELMFMMDQLEQAEMEKIQRDLRQFQTSRRRLMFNLSSLSATSSPPAKLMNPVKAAANFSSGRSGCV